MKTELINYIHWCIFLTATDTFWMKLLTFIKVVTVDLPVGFTHSLYIFPAYEDNY
jgi:hypothetical protein